MTARKRSARRPRLTQLEMFMRALREHEAHEDQQSAAREERTIKRIEAWLADAAAKVEAAVKKVTDYQVAVARAWDGEGKRLKALEDRAAEAERRIAALEQKDRS